MEKLIKLAQGIKDVQLRNKVIEYLKSPSLSSKEFKKYPAWNLEDVKTPFSIGGMGTAERDVLNHTMAVAEMCMKMVDVVENTFGAKINRDHLLAAAIIHDVMKVFEWKKGANGAEPTGILLDHTMLGVAELYKRDFPEHVIHMVASHFGEGGSTPPRNIEALVLHYVDNMLSIVEFYAYGVKTPQPQQQFIVLDEDTLRKLQGEE